jgi:SNF2 family DNA or RNA helicase
VRFSPRPWQPPMMDHVAEHKRCALFAGMGSGKSGAVLHALGGFEMLDEAPGLILGPLRVARDVWPDEARKWDSLPGLEVEPIVGTQTQRFQALVRDRPWFSMNYEQLPWLVEHLGKKRWPFRTIVADESTRLKGARAMGHGGKRTNALAKIAFLPQVERFIELTGTPAPNGIKDLWGQLYFLDQGQRLGRSHGAFMARWFQRGFDGYSVEPTPWAQKEIQELIADICLTIDPADYIPIDKPIETDVTVELPGRAMDLYREMEKKLFLELLHEAQTHEIEAVHAASRTNKCLQIAAGFVYNAERQAIPLHEAKLDALDSIREEANGMPLLVSYIFVEDLMMLKKRFPQLKHIDEVDTSEGGEWNKGHVPMMAAHPASAGHGLNLQWGSNILVDYTSGWDLEYDDQIIERIGPMRQFQAGLNRAVHRYRIMAHGTVDYLVKARRETKRSVQSILLEAMKRKEENNA